MLQIASGKLFQSEPGQRNELRGILYTNLFLTGNPIETDAGRLLPVSSLHDKTLVYEFTELIEAPRGVGVVASHGVEPYLNDFAAIVSFALDVTCTSEPELTSRLIAGRRGPTVSAPPRKFIRRVFDDQVWWHDEDTDRLVTIVRDLMGLRRKSYLAAMRAIRTYVTGFHRLADDLELAYTLLVASVESLVEEFGGHRGKWEDYDEIKRQAIDRALANADKETAKAVRNALLEIEHVSLTRRFRDFTLDHLKPSYFRQEAAGLDKPVGRTELPDALHEAYRLRSKYVHNHDELPKILTLGVDYRETVRIDQKTLLTIQGMARLARHVITEFIARQPKVKTEEYDYSNERSGIVRLPLAPQYWIGKIEGLAPSSGRKRLEGFLNQVGACFSQEPDSVVTDLRNVLAEVESMLPQMNVRQRLPFLALYYVFNGVVSHDDQLRNFPKVQKRYGPEIKRPSVESMLMHLVLGTVPDWTLAKHQEVHDDYFRNRDKKGGLKVVRTLEAGLSIELAERYRIADNAKRASKLVSFAVENHPGHATLYELEQNLNPKKPINWRSVVLPKHEATDVDNENDRQQGG